MVAFILLSRSPNSRNLCRKIRIHRTDNSKFEKIKILSYAPESWTPGVFLDGDRNGKAHFFVKVTERSRFDLETTFSGFLKKEHNRLGYGG